MWLIGSAALSRSLLYRIGSAALLLAGLAALAFVPSNQELASSSSFTPRPTAAVLRSAPPPGLEGHRLQRSRPAPPPRQRALRSTGLLSADDSEAIPWPALTGLACLWITAVAAWRLLRTPPPGDPAAFAVFAVTGAVALRPGAGAAPPASFRTVSILNPTLGSLGARRSTALNALKTGIVGLPNVGKSTLFNALTGGVTAEAANYPFCTIDPNVGIVEVPDKRLTALATLSSSQKVVPATLEFVDIAGIVKGASKGEGMGNKFLSNIRECDAVVHVVRCFEDENVIHVSGKVDPVSDMDVINLELVFADLEQVERRRDRAAKDKKATATEKSALDKVYDALQAGLPARSAQLSEDERASIRSLMLLTQKPMIYAANVPEDSLGTGNELLARVKAQAAIEGAPVVVVSAQLEAELVELSKDERLEMLQSLGVDEENCGLKALVRAAYGILGLQTYFTTGQQESRAWTIRSGMTAPQAAGVIHGDFERGFIRAETIAYSDLIQCGSEKRAREAGKLRSEGKEYVVQEADVMHFLFNV